MENQHRKITGYRELQPHEIDLINKIKEHASAGEALLDAITAHLNAQYEATKVYLDPEVEETRMKAAAEPGEEIDMPTGYMPTDEAAAERRRVQIAEPHRWLNIGRTDLQRANMALTRAVAQPTTF